MKPNNFSELKERILASVKEKAHTEKYRIVYSSENINQLMKFIKANFGWCVFRDVLSESLIEDYKELFRAHEIYCNESIESGYSLIHNASIEAYGNATIVALGKSTILASGDVTVLAWDYASVKALGSATVYASGGSNVEAYDNVIVKASGSAIVRAYGNAYVTSHSTIECQLSDSAIYRIRETNTIRLASDGLKIERV